MTHTFKSPKFHKELRMQYRTQVISKQQATASSTRAPGSELQASSVKSQASGSIKPQATSRPQADSGTWVPGSGRKHQAP